MPTETINGHSMYWEEHGVGEWLVCMGGWGSFCHGEHRHVPRVLLERYRVLLFDYPGIERSDRHEHEVPSTELYALDVLALCDRLSIDRIHVVGMVGMGGCVGQQLALLAPDRIRSLAMMGTWARVDPLFDDQLELFRWTHERLGFEAFQLLAATLSFDAAFYARNRGRILGSDGTWRQLQGRYEAHAALIEACRGHDVLDRLGAVRTPTLVIHASADAVTGPRLTEPIERAMPAAQGYVWPEATHIVAGREAKVTFDRLLAEHLGRVTQQAGAS